MKRFLTVLICAFILSVNLMAIPLNAIADNDHLETEAISESDRQIFWDSLGVEMQNVAQQQNAIACFAVSPDGDYALGFEDFQSKTVYVFDRMGAFRYGLKMNAQGSFGLFFSGDNLSVYFSRSRYVVTFDADTQCVDVQIVTMAKHNNAIINDLLYGTEKESNIGVYSLERDVGFAERSYARLVVCNNDGSRQILYDISNAHVGKIIASGIFFTGFIVILFIIIRFWTRKNHTAMSDDL